MLRSDGSGEFSLVAFLVEGIAEGKPRLERADRDAGLGLASGPEEPQPVANHTTAEGCFVNLIDLAGRGSESRIVGIGGPLRIGERIAERPGEFVATGLR